MRGGRLPVAGFFCNTSVTSSLESVKKTDFTIYSFEVIDALE